MNDLSITPPPSKPTGSVTVLPPIGGGPDEGEIRIDGFRRVLSVLRRRWMAFTAVLLFIIGAAAFYTWRQTPMYTATSNLVVNSRLLNVSVKDKDVLSTVPTQDGAVDTEVQILRSPEVLTRTVEALNLTAHPAFAASAQASAENRAAAAVAILKDNLEVVRPGDTNVVTVSYTSPDPALSRDIANEVGRQYMQVKLGTRMQAAKAIDQSLERELASLRTKLEQGEAAVARYKSANNLLSSQGVTLSEQEISIYKQQVATAQSALAEERARLNTARAQLNRGSSGDDVGEALNSQVVEQLRTQRSQLSTKVAELKARYRPQHPDVINAEQQLAEVDRGIQAEIGRVISNLEARTQVASQRAAAASGIAGAAMGNLTANNAAGVRLAELERQAEAYRSNYAALLERKNAIGSQTMIADEDARIFSPAGLPRFPASPNKPLNMVIGALLGLVVASLVTWLLHMFDRGVVTSREAEARLGLPHLANIPLIRSIAKGADRAIPAERFMIDRPMSIYAEALRSLRLSLLRPTPQGRQAQVIGITSSSPNEGKSTLALSLARTSALAGDRVLLIDGDVRRPSIAGMAGFEAEAGFLDVLMARARLEDVLVKDGLSELHILPSPVRPYAPSEIYRVDSMNMFLAGLRPHYDVIVIDTAPALAAADARVLLEQSDVVVMAVRWKKTLIPLIISALRKMRQLNIVPVGTVLTQVDLRAVSAYGFGDVDFNYRAYKSYYT